MNEMEERLSEYLISESAKILDCSESDIQWEDDIDEYGFTSMEVNRLCQQINDDFGTTITPAIFLELPTLRELSEHLLQNHAEHLEKHLSQTRSV